MSAGRSQVDIKPLLTDLDLDFSHTTATSGASAVDTNLHAFPLESPHDSIHAATPTHHLVEAAQFVGDFDFSGSYQNIERDASMVSLAEDHAADLFTNAHRRSISSNMPDSRSSAAASITAHVPGFRRADSSRRRPSIDASDDGSQESTTHGTSLLLDDPISDEFGLTSHGPSDGTHLGGKSKDDRSEMAPPWSELKTKAGKERKRLPLACIACRRKKIRCSGEKPACKHCIRSRIPCVYKVTARKAAPRTDYMAMLDKRLKRMEERIIKIVPKNEQNGMPSSISRAQVKPGIPGTLQSGKGNTRKRGADEAFGHDLEHWAKAPAKVKLESATTGAGSIKMIQDSEESKLLQEGVEALPPKEIQEHLAEVFFENVYGQAYHILHKPSYMRKLRAATLPPVLILSICAMSARFSNHPKLNSVPGFLRGEEWASVAREIVTKRYEWPNITILTCLLILGLHEFATCHGGRSWSLGGQAIRMAFALQLHKDLEYDPMRPGSQLSFIDREIRRRTMWACFLMDRFNSSGTDRPTFIKEESLKIPLPIKEKYFLLDMPGPTENLQGEVLHPVSSEEGELSDAKDNMGVAAYMIKAIAVWGRIINYLNQGGKEMDDKPMWNPESEYMMLIKQAEEMVASLPDSLVYKPENLQLHDTEGLANQFLFLHIAVQQNILFMNRFAMPSPNATPHEDVPKSFVTKAGAKAFGAANRISELLKDSESYLIAAPFVGYCAFLSSTVHVFGIFSGNATIEATSKRNLATNVRYLGRMKRYWGMFYFMTDNLREQYLTCADTAKGGPLSDTAPTVSAHSSSSPIFQYGDWFDRYPHGVSQSDFVDPATYKKKEKGEDGVLEQKPELHTVEEFFTTLSPSSQQDGRSDGAARSVQLKRKALAAKKGAGGGGSVSSRGGGSGTHDHHNLEPLMTELHNATPEQIARMRAQHGGSGRFSLGGQTSGAAGFNLLTTGPMANYHHQLTSPISPGSLNHGQFGGGHHHQHHGGHSSSGGDFYPPDILSLQLAQNGMLPHSLFPGYAGLDGGSGAHATMMDGVPGWDSENGQGGRPSRGGNDHNMFHHGPETWFMPFNMEAPEVGMGSMDFADMFLHRAGGDGGGGGSH